MSTLQLVIDISNIRNGINMTHVSVIIKSMIHSLNGKINGMIDTPESVEMLLQSFSTEINDNGYVNYTLDELLELVTYASYIVTRPSVNTKLMSYLTPLRGYMIDVSVNISSDAMLLKVHCNENPRAHTDNKGQPAYIDSRRFY